MPPISSLAARLRKTVTRATTSHSKASHDDPSDDKQSADIGNLLCRLFLLATAAFFFAPYLLFTRNEIYIYDDAYYYLLPAVNFWNFGYYTFDSVTHTNGFHPLWMAILTGVALPLRIANAVSDFPWVAQVLCAGMAAYTAQVLYSALRIGGAGRLPALLAGASFLAVTRDLHLGALETSLVFATVLTLIYYTLRLGVSGRPLNPLWFALLSLGVLLARLDSAALLLLLYAACVPFFGLRRVVIAGLLLTAFATPYFAFNAIAHGSPVPISGQVKSHWGDRYELETSGRTFGIGPAQIRSDVGKARLRAVKNEYLDRDLRSAWSAFIPKEAIDSPAIPWLSGALFALASVATLRRRRDSTTVMGLACTGVVLIHYIIVVIYYALSADRVWFWYGALGIGWFAALLPLSFASILSRPIRSLVCLALTGYLVFEVSMTGYAHARRMQDQFPKNLNGVYSDLGTWLKENSAKDATVAGWAVGEIGWHAGGNVVNLEGLIADNKLLERNKDTDLIPFLVENNIQYIANFWRPTYAPMPEEILRSDYADTHWANGKTRVRYFWTLRLRQFIDCPEAFEIVYNHFAGDHRDTSGHVFSVDQAELQAFMARRTAWRNRLLETATVWPAEEYDSLNAGRIEANVRRTMGFSTIAMEFSINSQWPEGESAAIYARVANLVEEPIAIHTTVDATKHSATVPPSLNWTMLKLTPFLRTAEETTGYTVNSTKLVVHFDEFYIVPQSAQGDFATIPADWTDGD